MTRWPPPPTLSAAFYKAHGLGNDYLVFEEGEDWVATPESVRRVCDRHRGVGSDGIVVLLGGNASSAATASPEGRAGHPAATASAEAVHVRLRMFNPDGSEFERSGNGLRVLASYLMRAHPAPGNAPGKMDVEMDAEVDMEMDVEVGGSRLRMVGHGQARGVYDVSVEMGRARTGPEAVGLDSDALDGEGRLPGPDGEALVAVPVSVGNPHVVIVGEDAVEVTDERLAVVGPFVAEHESLEHGANVQLVLAVGADRCRALVWERGVGRTSASGTSACAVAVALVSSGRLDPGRITVEMPGGELQVTVGADLEVVLRGPVEEVCEGRLTEGVLAALS